MAFEDQSINEQAWNHLLTVEIPSFLYQPDWIRRKAIQFAKFLKRHNVILKGEFWPYFPLITIGDNKHLIGVNIWDIILFFFTEDDRDFLYKKLESLYNLLIFLMKVPESVDDFVDPSKKPILLLQAFKESMV